MAELTFDQVVQCALMFADRGRAELPGALAGLAVAAAAQRVDELVQAYRTAAASYTAEKNETAAVEDAAEARRGQVHTVALMVARLLDYHELAGAVPAGTVAAARNDLYAGNRPANISRNYARSAEFLNRAALFLADNPWLDIEGTLTGRVTGEQQAYQKFFYERERELAEDAEARANLTGAKQAVRDAYAGAKEMVRGYLNLFGRGDDAMQHLFLDEDPRWAARTAGRSNAADKADAPPATAAGDDDTAAAPTATSTSPTGE